MEQASRKKRYLIAAAGVLTAAVVVFAALHTRAAAQPAEVKKAEEAKPAVPVSVVAVTSGTVSSYITATANLVPENEVDVLAETDGRITALLVEEGDRVGKGQILATLDRQDAEILLQKASVQADSARLAFERATRMAEEKLVTEQDYDKAFTEHKLAEQELAEARWRLDKTEIRAPFSGRVTDRKITVGQHVAPGAPLFRVTDFDPLIARIYLPEKDVLALGEGRDVRITLKADEHVRFNGRIRQISPVVDTATGTVKVTVEAASQPEAVRPGAFVTIDIVRETHAGVPLLPREAVVQELKLAHVFVVKDGKAEKRAVTLGIEDGAHREAVKGVEPGEQVVVAGQGGLKDGAEVKVVAAGPAAAPAELLASR